MCDLLVDSRRKGLTHFRSISPFYFLEKIENQVGLLTVFLYFFGKNHFVSSVLFFFLDWQLHQFDCRVNPSEPFSQFTR